MYRGINPFDIPQSPVVHFGTERPTAFVSQLCAMIGLYSESIGSIL